jgi:hypothetical protein
MTPQRAADGVAVWVEVWVGVLVWVEVWVGVPVWELLGVPVWVGVLVDVSELVLVEVEVGVPVWLDVCEDDAVCDDVWLGLGVHEGCRGREGRRGRGGRGRICWELATGSKVRAQGRLTQHVVSNAPSWSRAPRRP